MVIEIDHLRLIKRNPFASRRIPFLWSEIPAIAGGRVLIQSVPRRTYPAARNCEAVRKRLLSLVMLNKPCRNSIRQGFPSEPFRFIDEYRHKPMHICG